MDLRGICSECTCSCSHRQPRVISSKCLGSTASARGLHNSVEKAGHKFRKQFWRGPSRQQRQQLHKRILRVRAAKQATKGAATAKDAVEEGLEEFHQKRDAAAALSLFQRALQLSPTEEEARAAAYNSACAYAKLKDWKQAADAVILAVNTYGERLSTALNVSICKFA